MTQIVDVATVLTLAVLVEMLVEYFCQPLLQFLKRRVPRIADLPLARYASALAGVVLCLAYRLDVLSLVIAGLQPSLAGMIITGFLIARGSNYVHDWIANPIFRRRHAGG
jgi:hypothetical protein